MPRGVKKDRLTFEVELKVGRIWKNFPREHIHWQLRRMLGTWLNEQVRHSDLMLTINPMRLKNIRVTKAKKAALVAPRRR